MCMYTMTTKGTTEKILCIGYHLQPISYPYRTITKALPRVLVVKNLLFKNK